MEVELSIICNHSDIDRNNMMFANSLFPKIDFKNKRILIGGLGISRCNHCGEIFWPKNSESIKKELEIQCQNIVKSVTISDFILFNGTIVDLKHQLNNGNSLAEEANYILISSKIKLEDVILSSRTSSDIQRILAYISHRKIIYDTWNFRKVDPAGNGVSMLFYGPSGTGKTRTIEAISSELSIPLISVSLQDMESRFMGQTPKNISKAFNEAKKHNALLFFDEADTVLGKRLSSVTNGVDNEVNMERSTLLKELENYDGICAFATNFQENIDSAFRRRINFHIKFDLPDLETRKRILNYYLIPPIPLKVKRTRLIDQVSAITSDFSGADIVLALRIGFINAIMENLKSPSVSFKNIEKGVVEVKNSIKDVGHHNGLSDLKNMFNIQQ